MKARVAGIQERVRVVLNEIEAAAIADDAVIGQRIKEKLAVHVQKAGALLEKARAVEQPPTKAQAKELLDKFVAILGEARNDVIDDVNLLKDDTKADIVGRFNTALTKAKELSQKIEESPNLS